MRSRILEPGVLVWLKHSWREASYARAGVVLSDDGRLMNIKTHGSRSVVCVRADITQPRCAISIPFVSMRDTLPYGIWLTREGREVLFNRDYHPIWHRLAPAPPKEADSGERIAFEDQQWFWKDDNPPWRDRNTLERCGDILLNWGLERPDLTWIDWRPR